MNDFIVNSLCLCITRRCNLYCQHCFLDAGYDRTEEMSACNLAFIVDTSCSYVKKLWLSGGEPTINIDLLSFALKYVSTLRKSSGYPREIIVQTNAAWAKDYSSAFSMLTNLKRWGATGIDIASNDIYHWKQIGRVPSALAYQIAKSMGVFSTVELSGMFGSSGARRLGRGKQLAIKDTAKDECCTITPGDYVADTDGQIYPCCWIMSASLGNLLEHPLRHLVDIESELGWPFLLRVGGPKLISRKLAAHLGCNFDKNINESLCTFCGRATRLWKEVIN